MKLADFLNTHRFTHQARRELTEWLPEIAYRKNVSVEDIINGSEIQSILRNEKLNAPQKSKKVRDTLYKMRFPEYSQLQERWKKTVAAVNPNPSKVQFTPSPGFEKKRVEIKVTIEDAEEARKIFKSLAKIEPHIWNEILLPQ